jgi:hypothetical protein
MNDPSAQPFTAVITSETVGEEGCTAMLLSSPDIPGFYLCYEDPEQSYKLIGPVACFMIYRNLEKFVTLQSIDVRLLRDKGTAFATFLEGNTLPENDPDFEKYGMLIHLHEPDNHVFVPLDTFNGKGYYRGDVMNMILQRNGLEPIE